jgi:pathogenesis-related protein 1
MGRHGRRALRHAHGLALLGALASCEAVDVDPVAIDAQAAVDGGGAGMVTPFDGGAPELDGSTTSGSEAGPVDAATPYDASAVVDAAPSGSGRMAGMLEAHNEVRAAVGITPPLPALTWRDDIADYAQEWADQLAASSCDIMHRTGSELQAKGYGENIAFMPTRFGPTASTAKAVVDAWASEKMCWTYGTLSGFGKTGTEKCDVGCYTNLRSDGCGHYTAIVSKRSTAVGCGVATCKSSGFDYDIWVCNYNPAGNLVGQSPY